MRETKFRAWDKKNQRMCSVWDIGWKAWDEDEINYVTVEGDDGTYDLSEHELELLEYTGLKDKNGEEIYEGYVVRFLDSTGMILKAPVVFGKAEFTTHEIPLSEFQAGSLEVIGNIYEHPELLKK